MCQKNGGKNLGVPLAFFRISVEKVLLDYQRVMVGIVEGYH